MDIGIKENAQNALKWVVAVHTENTVTLNYLRGSHRADKQQMEGLHKEALRTGKYWTLLLVVHERIDEYVYVPFAALIVHELT